MIASQGHMGPRDKASLGWALIVTFSEWRCFPERFT